MLEFNTNESHENSESTSKVIDLLADWPGTTSEGCDGTSREIDCPGVTKDGRVLKVDITGTGDAVLVLKIGNDDIGQRHRQSHIFELEADGWKSVLGSPFDKLPAFT